MSHNSAQRPANLLKRDSNTGVFLWHTKICLISLSQNIWNKKLMMNIKRLHGWMDECSPCGLSITGENIYQCHMIKKGNDVTTPTEKCPMDFYQVVFTAQIWYQQPF